MTDPFKVSEGDLIRFLFDRYHDLEQGSSVFVPQVRSSVGHAGERERTIDGIAVGMWPSRGLELEAFEIKVSRSDWLQELRNPKKAEMIARYVDRFWVVSPSVKVVKPSEVPGTWGLLLAHGSGLRVSVQAPKLDNGGPDRRFWCSLLRAMSHATPTKEVLKAEYKKGYDEGKDWAEAIEKDLVDRAKKDAEHFNSRIKEFEKESGIDILGWNAGRIGKLAAELCRYAKDGSLRDLLSVLSKETAEIAERSKKMIGMLDSIVGGEDENRS